MTINNFFEIPAEGAIERCGRTMLARETKGLREEPDGRFCRTNDGNRARVGFDHYFRAAPDALHHGRKIPRRVCLRYADYFFGHKGIIHRERAVADEDCAPASREPKGDCQTWKVRISGAEARFFEAMKCRS